MRVDAGVPLITDKLPLAGLLRVLCVLLCDLCVKPISTQRPLRQTPRTQRPISGGNTSEDEQIEKLPFYIAVLTPLKMEAT